MNAAAVFARIAADLPELAGPAPTFIGADPILPTRYRIGAAVAAAIGAAAQGAAHLWTQRGGRDQSVTVSVRRAAASLAGFRHLRLEGRLFPAQQGDVPTMAIYQTRDDRWIHLHGALPHFRQGTLNLLGCTDDRAAVAAAVAKWDSSALEDALAAAGQCGAVLRTADEWAIHPQGRAVARAPLIELVKVGDAPPTPMPLSERPLAGIRVLDLTRILAGPVCGRTLAEHGAEVLNISSPHLPHVPIFLPETSHGKKTAHLHLPGAEARDTLWRLIGETDVFSQGYRAGGLARLGFGPDEVAKRRPGMIYVSINAYGHDGPWRDRPGWEQLAQSATGVALVHSNRTTHDAEVPAVVPAAPTDYMTGYLASVGVMIALHRRATIGGSWHVRTSLSRTAMWFRDLGLVDESVTRTQPSRDEVESWSFTRDSTWGRLTAFAPVAEMSRTPPRWDLPSAEPGSHQPSW